MHVLHDPQFRRRWDHPRNPEQVLREVRFVSFRESAVVVADAHHVVDLVLRQWSL